MQSLSDKALNRCYFYLKYRPRTEREIYIYLNKNSKKYRLNKTDVSNIISVLKEKSYLDDNRFIEWFINKRLSRKPKAAFLIKGELKRLGISEEKIALYFENNKIDEYESVIKTLERINRRFSSINNDEKKAKQISYLLTRGFRYDDIIKAVEEFNKKV